jgi:hypothetical protein
MSAIFDWIDGLPVSVVLLFLLFVAIGLGVAMMHIKRRKQNPSHDKSPAPCPFDGKSILVISHEEHAALHGFKPQQKKSPAPVGAGNGASAKIQRQDNTKEDMRQ